MSAPCFRCLGECAVDGFACWRCDASGTDPDPLAPDDPELIAAGRAAAAESAASEASAEFDAGYSPWTSEGVNT